MSKIQHLTMFKQADNENGFIQCVIGPQFVKDFTDLGFVTSVDLFDYSEPDSELTDSEEEELTRLESAKAKAKELGLRGYGNMSIETLEAKIAAKEAEKENDSN